MVTTHLAGDPVFIGDRVIQRCLICGFKLCDSLGSMGAVGEDGQPPGFPTWPVGGWIEQEGNCYSLSGETERPVFQTGDLPTGCCVELIE